MCRHSSVSECGGGLQRFGAGRLTPVRAYGGITWCQNSLSQKRGGGAVAGPDGALGPSGLHQGLRAPSWGWLPVPDA